MFPDYACLVPELDLFRLEYLRFVPSVVNKVPHCDVASMTCRARVAGYRARGAVRCTPRMVPSPTSIRWGSVDSTCRVISSHRPRVSKVCPRPTRDKANITRHVIQHILHPRFLGYMASYDVATGEQYLTGPRWVDPRFLRRVTHIPRRGDA